MKVAIWQEIKYKTNAANGGVAILIQSHPISPNLTQSQLKLLAFSSLYRKIHNKSCCNDIYYFDRSLFDRDERCAFMTDEIIRGSLIVIVAFGV
ncbi:MAG: hypothetical protein LBJ36_06975 [Synergistaceae bacterium]|jgi:hypothetical protein|nr:hypothetical protein [Synergistaceae bacterium]